VKAHLAETLEATLGGTETVVTRHGKAIAVVVSPSTHRALQNYRRSAAQAFASSQRALERMRAGRAGAPRPRARTIALMGVLLDELRGVLEIGPDRTVVSAEGGIDTSFFSAERSDDGSPARYVCVSVDTNGDATILFSAGRDAAAEELGRDTDARALAARITGFLSGADRIDAA
jgi:antitoxin (DNA-binding transcriptional repressor) of toxin-antitoxin stability system